ncbi:uncharacterized protein F5147DRAFT_763062 [Suillus discolor]|uniref:Uncharacterized protein n=1 Tax=Suillus discolor TaxID=1912936 RepID=A0A9P7EZH9_9AGAM|nr:uncharacterized protein F5147DRAFT_763062 [Suillus discolor]KAG2099617.1 hypothetical protein F5147DRAFT_763062 [Suillus discolor]
MVSISKVLRYDALDGSTISPLQITASKESAKLVCDAVDTQDLCNSTVTHLSVWRVSTAQLYAVILEKDQYSLDRHIRECVHRRLPFPDVLSGDNVKSVASMHDHSRPLSIVSPPVERLVFYFEFEDASSHHVLSESMPMSNDHVPLPGDPDLDSLSFEELGKLVAAHHSGEMSPEVCAQLDELLKESDELMRSVINEDALAGPDNAYVDGNKQLTSNDRTNYDELPATQQGTEADSQDVQNPQIFELVPTLKNFTALVAGLPQLSHIDQGLYYPPQISAVPQAPPQGHPWSQHEYNPRYFMNRPPNTYTQPSAAPQGIVWSQHGYNPGYNANGPPAPPQGYALTQHGYHPAPPYPYQQPSTIAGPSNANYPIATLPQGQYAPLQTESSGGSNAAPTSFALDETASTSPRKRKTLQTSDGLSPFVTPSMRKRRRPNTTDDYGPGKFGLYTLADGSATIMTIPVHDSKPVDIRSRRTHDPNGNPLRTRRFGAMELDDTYPEESGNVSDYHSSQLACFIFIARWTWLSYLTIALGPSYIRERLSDSEYMIKVF